MIKIRHISYLIFIISALGFAQSGKNREVMLTKTQLQDLIKQVIITRYEAIMRLQAVQAPVIPTSAVLYNIPNTNAIASEMPSQYRTNIKIEVPYHEDNRPQEATPSTLSPKTGVVSSTNVSSIPNTNTNTSTVVSTYTTPSLEEAPKVNNVLPEKEKEYWHFKTVIYFNNNATEVPISFLPIIDQVADILKQNSRLTVILEGYASSNGKPTYNTLLSMKRANQVAQLLQMKGISPNRIISGFKGEDNAVPDTFARRVELSLVQKD